MAHSGSNIFSATLGMSLDFRRISQIQFFRTLRDPECNTLEDLIRRWRQTAFALLGNKGVELTAPAEAEIARIELTSDRRRQLLLLFNEASATRAPRRGRLRMDRSLAVIMPSRKRARAADRSPGTIG